MLLPMVNHIFSLYFLAEEKDSFLKMSFFDGVG
jgi:hypothetical protein